MSESPLMIKSKAFALEVIRTCKVGRTRNLLTPIIAKGLVYPLQNRRTSKSATHGFASKSDTRHRKKQVVRLAFFYPSRRIGMASTCSHVVWNCDAVAYGITL